MKEAELVARALHMQVQAHIMVLTIMTGLLPIHVAIGTQSRLLKPSTKIALPL
jgi:hypothetical protein